jgi:hypothetical protein
MGKSSREFCFIPLVQITAFCQKLNVPREDEKIRGTAFLKNLRKIQ